MSAICLPKVKSGYEAEIFEKEIKNIGNHQEIFNHFLEIPKQVSIISGIYFLMNGRSVNYIGQSNNVITRCWSHLGSKTFDRVYAIEAPESFLDYLEAAFVSKFRPLENGNRNKKTHSCGAYCVRDSLAFNHPDDAIQIYQDLVLDKNSYSTRFPLLLEARLRLAEKSLFRDFNFIEKWKQRGPVYQNLRTIAKHAKPFKRLHKDFEFKEIVNSILTRLLSCR